MTTPINRVSARDSATLQFESAAPAGETAGESAPNAAEQAKSVDVSMGWGANEAVTLRVQSRDNKTHLFSFQNEAHLRSFLNDESGFDMSTVGGASGKEALLTQVAKSTDVTTAAFNTRRDGNIFAAENSPLPTGLKAPTVTGLRGGGNTSGSTAAVQTFLIGQGAMEATRNGKSEADGLNGSRTRTATLKYFAEKPEEYARFYETLSDAEKGRLPAPGEEFTRIASDPEQNQRRFNLPQARLAAFLTSPPPQTEAGEPDATVQAAANSRVERETAETTDTTADTTAVGGDDATAVTSSSGALTREEIQGLRGFTDGTRSQQEYHREVHRIATKLAVSSPEAAARSLVELQHAGLAASILTHTHNLEATASIIRALEPLGEMALARQLTDNTMNLLRRPAFVAHSGFNADQLGTALGPGFATAN